MRGWSDRLLASALEKSHWATGHVANCMNGPRDGVEFEGRIAGSAKMADCSGGDHCIECFCGEETYWGDDEIWLPGTKKIPHYHILAYKG